MLAFISPIFKLDSLSVIFCLINSIDLKLFSTTSVFSFSELFTTKIIRVSFKYFVEFLEMEFNSWGIFSNSFKAGITTML